MVGVGHRWLEVDGMGRSYVGGVIDSCGSIRNNRVRLSCPPLVLEKVAAVLDSYTVPYRLQPTHLTVGHEEGLILLYATVPLVCTAKRAALKKIVTRMCVGGLEPYPLPELDGRGWLAGVMDMRGSYIVSGKNRWYSITHTDTDLVRYVGQVLIDIGIDYKLYTVERGGRRTLYNTRIYRLPAISKLLSITKQ